MTQDPFANFKNAQRDSWKNFAPLEVGTIPVAGHLVRFAGVQRGQKVLDVGTGTGVVAITAAQRGAHATGLDLTPELLARAKENAALAGNDDAVWKEGDAENLPFRDGEFDVVLSQFAHIFAPRPEVATRELLRVLKPGGRIAFATWPAEQMVGRLFALVGRHLPSPPDPKPAPPHLWGNVDVIQQRLGNAVRDVHFERGVLLRAALSPNHFVDLLEHTAGPVLRVRQLYASDPARLEAFRRELKEMAAPHLWDNVVHEEYLLTRATKA
jgi:SAM-dependent methyltransferase